MTSDNQTPLPSRILTFGSEQRPVDIGQYAMVACDVPLQLESGQQLSNIPVAYQTYGRLSPRRDNAILLCHALTGDQFAAGTHPVTLRPGWWDAMIGPGRPFDTERYFIICSNVLGGCMGTLGPKDTNPATGKPYGLDFPVITIADMVAVQHRLITEVLKIDQLACVVGGSMGGMQALEWGRRYPKAMRGVLAAATSWRHSPQNIAFHEVGRQAVMADPEWHHGRYIQERTFPARGLAVARMTAHVTYLSEQALQQKFGRKLQNRSQISFGFDADFQVESYLRHQGKAFVDRFDPNSYLYITRAVDYFDLASDSEGMLAEAFRRTAVKFCLVSFTSDWLFPPAESRQLVRALSAAAAKVAYVEIESDKGHDAFLLDEPLFSNAISGFLEGLKLEYEEYAA
jgi:homoserine O-acetyltransferase